MRTVYMVLFLVIAAWSDVLPNGSTYYVRDIHISNSSQFPQYVLIDSLYSLVYQESSNLIVHDDVALQHIGAIPEEKYLFVVTRSLFDTHGGLEAIDFDQLRTKHLEMKAPFPKAGYVVTDDNCSVTKDAYYYRIESINDANITFKLQKRILTDSEGATQTINY